MTYTLCTKNQRCGKLEGHGGGCSGEPEPADSTTAEVFATLRECISSLYGYGHRRASTEGTVVQEQAMRTLALLERRMRGMHDALKMVSEQGINSQWVEGGRRRDMQREVQEALKK